MRIRISKGTRVEDGTNVYLPEQEVEVADALGEALVRGHSAELLPTVDTTRPHRSRHAEKED